MIKPITSIIGRAFGAHKKKNKQLRKRNTNGPKNQRKRGGLKPNLTLGQMVGQRLSRLRKNDATIVKGPNYRTINGGRSKIAVIKYTLPGDSTVHKMTVRKKAA